MNDDSFLKRHHAFLFFSADGNLPISILEKLKENFGFVLESDNPDYWRREIETFGIEESRELRDRHLQKAIGEGGTKIFHIKTKFITNEAQNSLLKILEEPGFQTFFFFVLPSKDHILPTLLSRFMVFEKIVSDPNEDEGLPFEMDYFLKLSAPARIKLLSKIISSKDKKQATDFLNHLERTYREKIDLKSVLPDDMEVFELIFKSKDYLKRSSASVKTILENVSLVVPKK